MQRAKRDDNSISAKFTQDDAEQIRAVVRNVGVLEGYGSANDFVEAAVQRELRRAQRRYNGGKPWEGVKPGGIRPGRRTRAETAAREDRQ
ncbi:ParB family protein [Paenarthrobacter ureafaciens]|uniref:ParB family protein n=1 Tax=Paenarthrobacter ureafaciens TaxID=37931 RepID=UPI0034643407